MKIVLLYVYEAVGGHPLIQAVGGHENCHNLFEAIRGYENFPPLF
jgi:hypothetical protein